MKQIIIIIATCIIVFTTTLLFEWSFIAKNQVRYILVILLIIVEIIVGFNAVKSSVIQENKK